MAGVTTSHAHLFQDLGAHEREKEFAFQKGNHTTEKEGIGHEGLHQKLGCLGF